MDRLCKVSGSAAKLDDLAPAQIGGDPIASFPAGVAARTTIAGFLDLGDQPSERLLGNEPAPTLQRSKRLLQPTSIERAHLPIVGAAILVGYDRQQTTARLQLAPGLGDHGVARFGGQPLEHSDQHDGLEVLGGARKRNRGGHQVMHVVVTQVEPRDSEAACFDRVRQIVRAGADE